MKVALINMPFARRDSASIQISILKSILNRLDVQSDSFYFNRQFANDVGDMSYDVIANSTSRFLRGEWLFARKVWVRRQRADIDYLSMTGNIEINLRDMRTKAENFVDRIFHGTQWGDYDIIAFTCTFDQIIPSLALGKMIKEKYSNILTMYGGANLFESAAIEYINKIPWIDFIFVGEAEESFKETISLMKSGEFEPDVRGVLYKKEMNIFYKGAGHIQDVNLSPLPDFQDFFNDIEKQNPIESVTLPYESSRGCWYGEKKQCKFCSLNMESMKFRSKDADVVYNDLIDIHSKWHKYNIDRISIVDNILNKDYIYSLMPRLNNIGLKFQIEVKPDLHPHEIKALHDAGVVELQPGIENFESNLLRLQQKGQSILNCISLLKWCKYFNIQVSYNLLVSIPFEKKSYYDDQLLLMKKLTHLDMCRTVYVQIERFGVYRSNNEVPGLRPSEAYKYIYPEEIDLNNVAYIFDYDHEMVTMSPKYLRETIEFMNQRFIDGMKSLRFMPNELKIIDKRRATEVIHEITDEERLIIKQCTSPLPKRNIDALFHENSIQYLLDTDIIVCLEGKYLSLVEIENNDDLDYCKIDACNIINRNNRVALKVMN